MKKSILNIGKALNRKEQKDIFGGNSFDDGSGGSGQSCSMPGSCPAGEVCDVQEFRCVTQGTGDPGSGGGSNGRGICPENFGQNCDSPF